MITQDFLSNVLLNLLYQNSNAGRGYNIWWCNGGKIDGHSEGFAKLYSKDGRYKGTFSYPDSLGGMPTWEITDTTTGAKRQIIGKKTPQARLPGTNGCSLTQTRRVITSDTGSPKGLYMIRSNTWSQPFPTGSTCNGDQDITKYWNATFTIVKC